jgi:hypothetical protein
MNTAFSRLPAGSIFLCLIGVALASSTPTLAAIDPHNLSDTEVALEDQTQSGKPSSMHP